MNVEYLQHEKTGIKILQNFSSGVKDNLFREY
jgi:hypothetical protein